MTRTARLLPVALVAAFAPALAEAGGADTLPKRADTAVRVRVAPSPDGRGCTMISAVDAQGVEHALRLEPKDGHVVAHGEPDPNRPWLGVLLSDAEEVARLGSGLPVKDRRWTITAVADDSPASRAGLERGDVITGVGGRDAVTDGPGLLSGVKPGDTVTFEIERDGKSKEVRVKIQGHPGTVQFEDVDGLGALDLAGNMLGSMAGLEALKSLEGLRALPCPPGTAPDDCPGLILSLPSLGGPKLGVSVESMSEQLAKFFGAPAGHGVLVKDVVAGSPAEKAGVQAGDVILRVDGDEIHAVGDIRAALEGKSEGDRVPVDVLRRGQNLTLDVAMDEIPQRGSVLWPSRPGTGSLEEAARLEREAAQLAREAAAQARAAWTPEARRQVEQEMAQAREAVAQARAAWSPAARVQLEKELQKAQEALGPEMRRHVEAAMQEAQRALEASAASGAFDEAARAELERALEGRDVRVAPAGLLEF